MYVSTDILNSLFANTEATIQRPATWVVFFEGFFFFFFFFFFYFFNFFDLTQLINCLAAPENSKVTEYLNTTQTFITRFFDVIISLKFSLVKAFSIWKQVDS